MRKYLVFIIVLIVLAGCSPATRLNRIYTKYPEWAPKDDTIVTIEYRDSLVYKDTAIYVTLPADTVYEQGEIIYIPGDPIPFRIKPNPLIAETDYAKAVARIDYMTLKLQLTDKDTTLLLRLNNAVRESYFWKNKYEQVTKTVPTAKIPKFYRIMTWVGVGLILMLLVWGFIKKRS